MNVWTSDAEARRAALRSVPDAGIPHLTEGDSPPKVAVGSGTGVDRLSLSFPCRVVDRDRFDVAMVRSVEGDAGPEDRVSLSGRVGVFPDANGKPLCSVFVGTMEVEGVQWGKVECNPARLADPDGISLLPVGDVEYAARMMVALAAGHIEPTGDLGDANVKRLDAARNFEGIADPSFFVRGLLNVKRPYARRTYLYADPVKGNCETLFAGSGAGGTRLYDQHQAYGWKAAEGTMRWEVEGRPGWLEPVGIRKLRDASAEAITALIAKRWEWSRMGTEVMGTVGVVEAIEVLVRLPKDDPAHLSRAKADRLLGQLVREALGVGRPSSQRSAERYEQVKRRLGVVPAADLFGNGVPVVDVRRRLDFETGTEVAA